MKHLKRFNESKIDDWFERNSRYVYERKPFEITVNDLDCAESIKSKYNQVSIIKIANPRVVNNVTYTLIIKNWSNIEQLKEIMQECEGCTSSYGFTTNEQIEAYKRMASFY